jgi:LysM domain
VQEQVDDQDLAGLARQRVPAARPVASADPTVLGPAPAPLDCPYLHLDDDGPSCLALPPAIRLSRRQVEIVCAVAAHVACPRLIKADAGRLPVAVDPPAPVIRRPDRPAPDITAGALPVAAMGLAASLGSATAEAAPTPPETVAIPIAAPASEPVRESPPIRNDPLTSIPPAPAIPAIVSTPRPTVEPQATDAPVPAVTQRVGAALTRVRVTARRHVTIRPATATAWIILVGTLIVVIALLTARGGLTLPSLEPSSAGLAGANPSLGSPSATVAPTPSASPSSSPSVAPSPSLAPSPSASPSSAPSPTPSTSPSPSVSSPFSPEQLAVLKPCPGKPDCYQYRIKSGDNLHNIATFFGVTYPALLAANPQITDPSVIHVGQAVIVPFPKPPKPSPTPKP